MKKLVFVSVLLTLLLRPANANYQPLGNLPIGDAASSVANDSLPFTNFTTNVTQRLLFSDLPNIPSLANAFASSNNPVFNGILSLKGAGAETVSLIPPTTAFTSYNFNFPLTPGSSGQVLTSAGGGTSAMTWSTPLTSIGLTVPGSSIFGVTNSPLTSNGNLNLTTTGTSGGIPYFSSSSQLLSSPVLTSNQLVMGGGPGTGPSPLPAGSQYQVLTMGASNPGYGAVNLGQSAAVTGTLPNANTTATSSNQPSTIVQRDSSGNFFANQVALNQLTLNNGNILNNSALYVQGASTQFTASFIGNNASGDSNGVEIQAGTNSTDMALQVENHAASSIFFEIKGDGVSSFFHDLNSPDILLNGSSSGTVSVLPPSTFTSYNFNLPATPGSAGQVLTSQGGLGNAMTWSTPSTGSVTSVGLTVPSSSIFGVTNSPITSSGNLVLTTTGTSGGIPYFSSTSQLSSSPVLTSSQLVTGGGPGAAPSPLPAGSQFQVLTMGASNPGYGAVNLAQSAAVTGILPNSNTTATDANTASAIVARDSSGNFTASTITAALTGTASGNTTYTANNHGVVLSGSGNAMTVIAPDASTSKLLISGGLTADPTWGLLTNSNLSGSAAITNANLATMSSSSSTVGTVKGNISGSSATPSDLVLTSGNTFGSVVYRDSVGNFSASIISAQLDGTASGNTTYSPVTHGVVISGSTNTMSIVNPDANTNKVFLSGGSSADPVWGLLTNSNLSGSAAISNANLATMASTSTTVGTVKGNISGASATPTDLTLTSANTASSVVYRDGSGNFSAGTITGSLTGTASGNTTYTPNQFGVVTSGAGNTMTVVAPVASTALPLVSGGSAAIPTWSVLGVAGGGTGITSGTSGGVPYFSSVGAIASSGVLTANQVVLGGGVGAAPSPLPAGSQFQVLTMGASNPGYGAVNLAQSAAVTGTLPTANGGTGVTQMGANQVFAGPSTGPSAAPSPRALVAADIPSTLNATTINTSVTSPLHIGGTTASSSLTLESTSGTGTTDSIIFKTGSQATVMTINNSGNVGIGTTSPSRSLEVDSSGGAGVRLKDPSTANGGGYLEGYNSGGTLTAYLSLGTAYNIGNSGEAALATQGATSLKLGTNNTTALSIDSSQQVFIPNMNTSTAALDYVCWNPSTGKLTADSAGTCLASTQKVKENIQDLDIGLKQVMNLHPISFDYKKEYSPRDLGDQVGFIAEEVVKVDSRLVSRDSKGEFNGVRYSQMTSVLTKAIQEQQQEIEDLRKEIILLKARNK